MLIEFEKACSFAFERLSHFNKITKVDAKNNSVPPKYAEVWKVTSEIEVSPNTPEEFDFYVCFKSDFPLSFPWIYLSRKDYDQIKYVPHVDSDRQICTFDRNLVRFDPSRPDSIVYNCLKKAKEIITDGLRKTNIADFENEFLAYWNNTYSSNDKVFKNCLFLMDENNDSQAIVKMIFVPYANNRYNYIFHQNHCLYGKFLNYLKKNKIPFSEHEVLYLGEKVFRDTPPFQILNSDVVSIIKSAGIQTEFKRFVKKKDCPAIILFRKKILGRTHILGWTHDDLNFDKNGLSKWKRISFDTIKYQGKSSVTRLSPDIYSSDKLARRTAGSPYSNPLKLLIAGLGSIGSNLVFFLNSLENPEFRLVDTEILEIENIGRHLIGFSDINTLKTSAVENYILKKHPHQEVKTSTESIRDVIQKEPNFVNDADYIFIAIGPGSMQDWVGEAISNKTIKKPIFFIWVEPFLVGGHCIYLHPESKSDYKDFFDKEGYFKFNVIDTVEYQRGNENLFMKEAGCQTSYTPYPISNVILFLSQLFPTIINTISNKHQESSSYTWFGTQDVLRNKDVKISKYGSSHRLGEFIRNHDEN